MIDEALLEIVKLDTESMYKLFYSVCDDADIIRLVRSGGGAGLVGVEIYDLLDPRNDRKPKSQYIFIRNGKYRREVIRAEIEARTKVMVKWFKANLGNISIVGARGKKPIDIEVGEKGINFGALAK